MKTVILFFFSFLYSITLSAQRPDTTGTAVFFQTTMSRINPKHAGWVKKSAKEFSGQFFPNSGLGKKANEYGKSLHLEAADIDVLALLVLVQVAKQTDRDRRAALEEVKKLDERKVKIREAITKMSEQGAIISGAQLDSFKTRLLQPVTISRRANPVAPATQPEMDILKQKLSNDLVTVTSRYDAKYVQAFRTSVNLDKMLGEIAIRLNKIRDLDNKAWKDLK